MPLDEREHPVGFDIVRHDHRATHEQHRQDVDPGAADAEERGEGDRHVVVAEFGAREEVDDVPGHVGVRQHHALREARRPRRVREEQQIVEVDRHVGFAGRPVSANSDSYVQRAGARAAHGDPVQDRRRERGFGQRRVLEDDKWIRVGDNDRTLVRRQVVVDRGQDGTDPPGGEQRSRKAG